MDYKGEELNLLDTLLDPIVDDELIAELDSQEKKTVSKQVSPKKSSVKSTDKTIKKIIKTKVSSKLSKSVSSIGTEGKSTSKAKADGNDVVRKVVVKSLQKNEAAPTKTPVRIVKKIVPKTSKTSASKTTSVPAKIIQKTIIVKKEPSSMKLECAPKRSIPTGICSAPSMVRKPLKVVSKKPSPLQQSSQTAVKCVLKGTDPESKALANKCKSVSNNILL